MPKLSATSGQDPEAIVRVDITPEMIRTMRCNKCKELNVPLGECRHAACEDLEELLRKLRGNREVTQQKAARRGSSSPKEAPPASDEEILI